MCDVDHFKAINDEFGHSAGDRVLQQIANSLTEYVRRNDIVSRWGGEEFLVIFSEIKLTAARIVAERQKSPFKNWADMIQRVRGVGDKNAVKLSKGGLTVGNVAYARTDAAPNPANAKTK